LPDGEEQAGRIPPKPFSVVATEVRGDDRKHALPWHGAVYERWLARNARPPFYSATNRIPRGAVNNVRFSFCSLKAEADGDLRVGAWVE